MLATPAAKGVFATCIKWRNEKMQEREEVVDRYHTAGAAAAAGRGAVVPMLIWQDNTAPSTHCW